MKILHVIQRYAPAIGGAETWCREAARYARCRDCQVRLFTIEIFSEREFTAALPPEERIVHLGPFSLLDGVEIYRFPQTLPGPRGVRVTRWLERSLGILCWPPYSLPMYAALGSAVRWADVVHVHALPFMQTVVGYAWARLLGKPVVITPHFHIHNPCFERPGFYALLRRCDRVFVMTEQEGRHVMAQGVSPRRLVVVGNGVDPREYEGGRSAATDAPTPTTGAEDYRILFLGRKEDYKGIPTLLRAFQIVRTRLPHVTLSLIGPRTTGWFETFWNQCDPQLKVGVIERDWVPHDAKVHILRQAHVLVLPSQFEAFGIVLLEAWVCGVPVVVPADSALAEVAAGCGLTFRLHDAEDLASQLVRLGTDASLRRVLAQRGQARVVERYTTDRIGALVLETYRRVIPRRSRMRLVNHAAMPVSYAESEHAVAA